MAQSEDEKAVQNIKDPTERKKAYYTRQRQNASAGSATQKKIQSKLNLGDEIRGFAKDTLGKVMASGPFSIPGGRAEEAASSLIPRVGEEAEEASTSMVPRRSSAPPAKHYQHLGRATPVKKALPSNKRALGSSKAPSVGRGQTSKALSGAKSPKALPGGSKKALTSSEHGDYNAELGKQTKRAKIPGGKKGAVKGSRRKVAAP